MQKMNAQQKQFQKRKGLPRLPGSYIQEPAKAALLDDMAKRYGSKQAAIFKGLELLAGLDQSNSAPIPDFLNGLSERVARCLLWDGIITPQHLKNAMQNRSDQEWTSARNMGPAALAELKAWYVRQGVKSE